VIKVKVKGGPKSPPFTNALKTVHDVENECVRKEATLVAQEEANPAFGGTPLPEGLVCAIIYVALCGRTENFNDKFLKENRSTLIY
jgi:hypothetical protein